MTTSRLQVLDGWRGISISLVLAGHLFPLGPKKWDMNEAIAASGMAIFFILSGFLITGLLLRDDHVGRFLIRRFMRIVPLAWVASALTLCYVGSPGRVFFRHFAFIANWAPMALVDGTGHLWSLCVEVQFYASISLLVLLLKQRGLLLLPIFGLAVTLFRVVNHVHMAINTYYRIDEILAGCMLALLYYRRHALGEKLFVKSSPLVFLPLLILSSHPAGGFLNYLRPYIAMIMIGNSLFSDRHEGLERLLKGQALRYLANVSYALYVIHGCLTVTWLESGSKIVRYLKRPLFLAATFGLAHFSTFCFENHCIDLGKRLSARLPA